MILKSKKIIITISIMAVIVISGLFSLLIWTRNFPGIRKTFTFASAQGNSEYIESRYLPSSPDQGLLNYYVEELLLGPLNELSKPIFNRGTRLKSCFKDGSTLYVELSDELLAVNPDNGEFKSRFELFEKNIKKNFSNIESVEIYIDGNEGLIKILMPSA